MRSRRGKVVAWSSVTLGVVVLAVCGFVFRDSFVGQWYIHQLRSGDEKEVEAAVENGLVEVPGVVLHDGAPVPGAWVRYVRHKGGRFGGHLSPQAYIAADENGRFTVRNEPGATMWITAQGPGFAVARSEVVTVPAEGPAPEVIVSSLPGDDLTVRVVDSGGRPVERVLLVLWRDGARWEDAGRPPCGGWGRTDGDGNWVFARLPAGEYALDARGIDERLHAPRKTFSWPAETSSIVLTVE